jgi:hypothetical protein
MHEYCVSTKKNYLSNIHSTLVADEKFDLLSSMSSDVWLKGPHLMLHKL